jgi:hypothetical protein
MKGVSMAKASKPNIVVIMGDDIGWMNPSCYHRGMMGYWTPNIDRIANEGALFTDWYGQQSCTAGRAAFLTGQCPIRPGLTKVGLPGADIGIQHEDLQGVPAAPEIGKFQRRRGRAEDHGRSGARTRAVALPRDHAGAAREWAPRSPVAHRHAGQGAR